MVSRNVADFNAISTRWVGESKTHYGLVLIDKKVYKNSAFIAEMLALFSDEDLTNRTEWIG
jgi:hypothetical protein